MEMKHIRNTKNIVTEYMKRYLYNGSVCLDATVGNGNDINSIAKLIGDKGKVYGFDIQERAIKKTRELLVSNNLLDRAILIKDTHENIDNYISDELNFVIYNLGYLPKGDKNIKTNDKSTINSIKKALKIMANYSLMLITSYIGHPGGGEENLALNKFLSSLNQRVFNVVKYEFINQLNNPPVLYVVEKL